MRWVSDKQINAANSDHFDSNHIQARLFLIKLQNIFRSPKIRLYLRFAQSSTSFSLAVMIVKLYSLSGVSKVGMEMTLFAFVFPFVKIMRHQSI